MADFDQIKSAVENSHLRICTKQEARRVGIYPNRKATFDYLPGVGAIIVRRGDRDFALGKRALTYLRAAITGGRIEEGWIVLLTNDGFVNAAPLDEVERI